MPTRPRTQDLAVSRHALMAEAFEVFGSSMSEFVEREMAKHFNEQSSGGDWAEAAAAKLGRPVEHGASDPLFQLLVMRRFWGPIFGDFFGEDLRPLIGQLIEARNLWAHFNLPSDTAYCDRLILATERIVAPVAPDRTTQLRKIRARLKNPLTDDVEPEGAPLRVDVRTLTAQLRQTEAAFEDLQRQFGQLTDQLEHARRTAAGKQLKLSAAEAQSATLLERYEMLEDAFEVELMTRSRMEWLFVGFITVMVLVMLILGAA